MSLDVYLKVIKPTVVYDANITHNLGKMADAAGLYMPLWRPEEIGVTVAAQLVPFLETGIEKMRAERGYLLTLAPANGWGDYEGLLSFAENYLRACLENPGAAVSVSR